MRRWRLRDTLTIQSSTCVWGVFGLAFTLWMVVRIPSYIRSGAYFVTITRGCDWMSGLPGIDCFCLLVGEDSTISLRCRIRGIYRNLEWKMGYGHWTTGNQNWMPSTTGWKPVNSAARLRNSQPERTWDPPQTCEQRQQRACRWSEQMNSEFTSTRHVREHLRMLGLGFGFVRSEASEGHSRTRSNW